MVNEEKTCIMTRIARYEKDIGGKVINEGRFYKTDYVRAHTLSVICNFSFAFILILVLIALYNIDYIFLNFVAINYARLAFEIFAPYIVILFTCIIISHMYFSQKYNKNRKLIKRYYMELKRLEKYYADTRKETSDDTTTGV